MSIRCSVCKIDVYQRSYVHAQEVRKYRWCNKVLLLQNTKICQSIAQQFILYTLKCYIVRATCFNLNWVILRPSKETDTRLHRFFL